MTIDPFKLVEQGYEIFPVQVVNPGTDEKELKFLTKQPWNVVASSDPQMISQWIGKLGKKLTDWGVPTGHRNGFSVIDIDSPEAEQWWSAQWLPAGKEVETPSGGLHVMYSLDGVDADIKTGQNDLRDNIDTRGEGGFVIAYTDDMSDIPVLPESVLEILPQKQVYNTAPAPADARPADIDEPVRVSVPGATEGMDVTPQEARVLRGLTDMLDDLPVPWFKGAGYHSTQFMVACGLNRIANSPFYVTDVDSARELFMAHAPMRDDNCIALRNKRWEDAVKTAHGQWFDPPSDVPIRLDANTLIDKYTKIGRIDRLYWEGKTIGDVKDLIRELREAGATEQEAYSLSWASTGMNSIRERNPGHSGSTWGFVKEIYDAPVIDPDSDIEPEEEEPKPAAPSDDVNLLEAWERDAIRDYPNFIDRYIMTAQEVLAEPNMPLHYVNAWVALSCIVGDRADIYTENGRVPCNLWGMPTAPSAAGKGDAKKLMIAFIDSIRRGGFASINAGGNASAEALTDFISENDGKLAFFNRDESASLLDEMHRDGSYQNRMMDLALDLYDGSVSKNLRVNNASDGAGENVKTTFNMWLQTTWGGVVGSLDAGDIGTGFVGRFLIAIGDDAKITDDSLRPRFASEYQIQNGGVHPMIKSVGEGMNAVIGRVKNITVSADDEVTDRYVEMRKHVLEYIRTHQHGADLRGIMLRVTENMLKAAALLAVSEGRPKIEMADLLIAIKSGQYWVRDAIRLVEAISTSEYRKRVEAVVKLCSVAPRTRSQIMRHFENMQNREIIEVLERAEQEGSIKKTEDGKRWVANVRD